MPPPAALRRRASPPLPPSAALPILTILAAVADLFLAGARIIGKFAGVYSGHATNNALLRALFADPEAWKYDAFQGQEGLSAIDGGIFPELAETA